MQTTKLTIGWWITLLIVAVLALAIQYHIFLSWSVSWHLEIARRFLHGGHYGQDFSAINTPMVIYLYSIPLLLQKIIPMNIINLCRWLTVLFATGSIMLSYQFTRVIFADQKKWMHGWFMLAMAVTFFILPTYEFCQQKHIILLLITPYLISMAYRAMGHKVPWLLASMIGVMAGIGFVVNMELFLILIACEVYLMVQQKTWRSIARVDIAIVWLVFIAYLASIVLFVPQYLGLIVPTASFLFFYAYHKPLTQLLFNLITLTWVCITVLLPFHWKHCEEKHLLAVLYITSTVYFIAFLLTRMSWYHHMMPTLAASIMVLMLYLLSDMRRIATSDDGGLTLLLKTVLVYAILAFLPLSTIYSYTQTGVDLRAGGERALNRLTNYVIMNQLDQPIFVFSTATIPASTLIEYANATLGSRYADMWMVPSIVYLDKKSLTTRNQKRLHTIKTTLMRSVVEDFKKNKPYLVIVDDGRYKPYLQKQRFDFIRFFSQDPTFKKIWSQYKLVHYIDRYAIYKRS